MDKKTIGLMCLCLLACAGVGTCVGVSTHYLLNNRANAAMVMAEDISEDTSSEDISSEDISSEDSALPEEEESDLQAVIDELTRRYDEIRDTQIFGTSIGAIIGAVVGAVVSLTPSLLNRTNIKTALEEVTLAKRIVDDNKALADKLKKDYAITSENYDKVVVTMGNVSDTLDKTQRALYKLSQENAEISAENKELKALILELFSQSKVLTSLGISEEVFKKYISDKVSK